uniref:Uncharacterized protein n=1 Tax=Timema bartmani TaxID=61472 RepID=A0A7R9F757_9NEOP|nr:unnamed protein product [Timema bartmani]
MKGQMPLRDHRSQQQEILEPCFTNTILRQNPELLKVMNLKLMAGIKFTVRDFNNTPEAWCTLASDPGIVSSTAYLKRNDLDGSAYLRHNNICFYHHILIPVQDITPKGLKPKSWFSLEPELRMSTEPKPGFALENELGFNIKPETGIDLHNEPGSLPAAHHTKDRRTTPMKLKGHIEIIKGRQLRDKVARQATLLSKYWTAGSIYEKSDGSNVSESIVLLRTCSHV